VYTALHATGQASKVVKVLVHGDDLVIFTNKQIPVVLTTSYLAELGVELVLDPVESTPPGTDRAYFLGSS
jgi:hypothetical protein